MSLPFLLGTVIGPDCMADAKAPPVTEELLKHLERQFPDRCPPMSATDREVWMAVGAAKVVRHIRTLFARQNSTVLSP